MIDIHLQWRTVCVALAVAVGVTALAWTFAPPVYLTNDDVSIRLALEGQAEPGQPPTGFVLLTHAVLGWALVALHRLTPGLPLWDLTIVGTLLLAVSVLVALAWNALGRAWPARATALSVVLVAVLPLFGSVQFTFGATLAGAAAVLAAGLELVRGERPRRAVLAAAAGLFLLGALVRPMGAMAGGLAGGLALLPLACWPGPARWARALRLAGVATVAGAAVGLLLSLDTALYTLDEEASAYHRYNWQLAQILEWGGELQEEEVEAMRAAAGWSRNDWAMLEGWFGVDPAVHGYAQVASAYETRGGGAGWLSALAQPGASGPAGVPARVRRLAGESVMPLAALAFLVGAWASRRGLVAAALVVLLFAAYCLAIETVFKELPFRLLAPLQGAFLVGGLLSIAGLRRAPHPVAVVLGLSAVLLLAVQDGRVVAATLAAERRHALQVDGEVAALADLSPSLLVLHADAFPAEHWWRPFHTPPTPLAAVHLIANNQRPALQRFLRAAALQPLPRALCDDPSILIVAQDGRLEGLTAYLDEHHGLAVAWERVVEASFEAWRCVVVSEPAADAAARALSPATPSPRAVSAARTVPSSREAGS